MRYYDDAPDMTCPRCGYESLEYDYEEHTIFCEARCGYVKYLPKCGHCGKPLPQTDLAVEYRTYGDLCKKCFEEEEKAMYSDELFWEAMEEEYALDMQNQYDEGMDDDEE